MKSINLGKNIAVTSPIGVGTRLWGSLTENEAIHLIDYARQLEINLFDTADVYGQGKAEEVLGSAIRHFKRNEIVLATKGGMRKSASGQFVQDSSPEYIREAIGASLRRLQTDYVDLYQIHYYDFRTHPHKTARCLAEFVETGQIKAIGISNVDRKTLQQWLTQEFAQPVTLQTPWNLLQRTALPLIQEAKAANIKIIGYTPLLAGLLTPKVPEHLQNELPPSAMEYAFELREKIEIWANQHDLTMPEVAMAWAVGSRGTDITLLGVRKIAHLKQVERAIVLSSDRSLLSTSERLKESLPEKLPNTVIPQEVAAIDRGWDNTPSLQTLKNLDMCEHMAQI
ncbi:MAG: aldo/keto reductase, partial [Candidatus Heimdallarchaeota archaeon]